MQSCILDSTPRTPSSWYSVLDSRSLSLELGFLISIFRGILDSKSQDFGILPPPPNPLTKEKNNNFVDSLTWGDLMFNEVLKCLRADRTKHVIGPIEAMLMTNIVPELSIRYHYTL